MPIQLSIPTPCHESWDKMQPVKDGRHCMACRKTVVDFSNMTDQEILDHIAGANGEVCGRADEVQLNRGLRENKFRKRFSWAYVWNMIILLFVFAGKTKAQGSIKIKQETVAKNNAVKKEGTYNPKKAIAGIVKNAITGEPVAFASVMLKNLELGVSADSAGKFILDIPAMDGMPGLEISSLGFEKSSFSIDSIIEEQEFLLSPSANELNTVTVRGYSMGRMRSIKGGATAIIRCATMYEKVSREVSDWLGKKDVVVYPNPIEAGNHIQVALQLKDKGQYRLDLVDASGRVLWMQMANLPTTSYKLSIPTQSIWSAGVYWLRISGKHTNKVYNGKIILR